MWRFASLASVAVVATGLLPWDETSDVTWRMAPILLFLVAITVLAELAEVAMVFDIAAREAAHLARGRTPVLFLLVAGLATLTTILLGLDTTAVLLTPVVLALALVVAAALRHGGDHLVASITGTGSGAGALLHVAGVGAVTSNLLNNLPAYLVVEPIAAGGGPSRLLALLVGTNVGPLVLLWGSLATLLWRHRCRARGVEVSAQEFAVMGLLGVPVVLVASTFAFVADVALGVINETAHPCWCSRGSGRPWWVKPIAVSVGDLPELAVISMRYCSSREASVVMRAPEPGRGCQGLQVESGLDREPVRTHTRSVAPRGT